MKMRFWYLTFLLVGLIAAPCAGNAQSRVALVIGNSTYQNVLALPNPVNDASDISGSLKRLGFDVKTLTNAKFDDMRRALIGFGQQARGAEFAIVFFAGHGMEIAGENWLIPVDAQLATDLDVASETIGLQTLTRAVSNTTKLGLVILDACRSNPFLLKMQRTSLTRAVDRGLARVEPNDNVLVAYSARDGTTAKDGSGRNSPFTSSLLKSIETPGLDVRFLFAGVRDDVMAATNREQQPFIYGSLPREQIYLRMPLPREKSEDITSADEIAWSLIKDTKERDSLKHFIELFPASRKLAEAQKRLATLGDGDQGGVALELNSKEIVKRPAGTLGSAYVLFNVEQLAKVHGVSQSGRNVKKSDDQKKQKLDDNYWVINFDGRKVFMINDDGSGSFKKSTYKIECFENTANIQRNYRDMSGQHVEMSCSFSREDTGVIAIVAGYVMHSDNLNGFRSRVEANSTIKFLLDGEKCTTLSYDTDEHKKVVWRRDSAYVAELTSKASMVAGSCKVLANS